MNNKFENENEEEKLLKSASLTEQFIRTLDRISVYPYISKALYTFSYISFLIFKARLKKYFCLSFPKNKMHSNTHHTHIRFKF